MIKTKVSQDDLYKFLLIHDVKLARLSDMIGCDPDVVTSCFSHRKDRLGRPRKFNAEHIAKLNEVLPRFAEELLGCRLKFGTPSASVNKNGKAYDPGLVEPIKKIGNYLNITAMLKRVAGWSAGKKSNVLCRTKGSMAGRVTKEDEVAINAELLSIAGVLERYEIVGDEDN